MYAEIRSRPQSSPVHPPFHRTLADDLATDNIPGLEVGRRRAPPRYSQPSTKVLNRTYSDESMTGYSTDSLLSILSHDSYTTPTDSDLSDEESRKPYREERPPEPPMPKPPPARKQKKEKKTSHWEEWVIRKTQEEREKKKKQAWKRVAKEVQDKTQTDVPQFWLHGRSFNSFYNPVPWMPIHVPQEKQQPKPKVPDKKRRVGRQKIQHQPSPPLLWKEVEQRTVRKQSSLTTRKR
ncbi:coiled-coil domain-containing protein 34 [Branchiostoma belcheri]|nr:coiled-coil domain-containing protein 34 [Branchiostoma belcheri]